MAHKITIKLILVSFFTLFSIQLNAQCEVENNNFKGGGISAIRSVFQIWTYIYKSRKLYVKRIGLQISR